MDRISYEQYLRLARDPDVPDDTLVRYSVVVRGPTPFSPELRPNPRRVLLTPDERELENALKLGNNLARFRRQQRFRRRLAAGERLPVLVAEGDSWFQFPLLISEVVDHLGDEYLIWCVSAAGDTLANMLRAPAGAGGPEYLQALRQQRQRVRAFLFSAAGNDVLGEDRHTGRPVIEQLVRPFAGAGSSAADHIDRAALDARLAFIRAGYAEVIRTVRAEPGLARLPILIHGYDHAFPYPWQPVDRRRPLWADKDEWLGKPLDRRGIAAPELRRGIVRILVDELYRALEQVAGDPAATGVYLVDCRGALPRLSDWADEIHGTSRGFAKVAARFRAVLRQVALMHP